MKSESIRVKDKEEVANNYGTQRIRNGCMKRRDAGAMVSRGCGIIPLHKKKKKSVFSQKEKEKINTMDQLFGVIDGIYNSFDKEARDFIDEYHNYEGSLGYCIRWGQQACCDFSKE